MRSGGSGAVAAAQVLGTGIGPTSGTLQTRQPVYPPNDAASTPESIAPSRTQRPGAGRSSSQSPLQIQVTTSKATGKTASPQSGSIPAKSSPICAEARASETISATTPAVIPRGIAIPQSTATAKPIGRPRASRSIVRRPRGPAGIGYSITRYASGPQMIASPKHQTSIFASQTDHGRAP